MYNVVKIFMKSQLNLNLLQFHDIFLILSYIAIALV